MTHINMKYWLEANARILVLPTDKWYLDFANKLLQKVKESSMYKNEPYHKQKESATILTLYFENAIAQNGGWKYFKELYFKFYNRYLPFYTLTDDYVPDEINKEDIAFLLWTLNSKASLWEDSEYTHFDPFDENLLELSQTAYDMMDEYFEQAPICEHASSDIWVVHPNLLEAPMVPLPEITPQTKLKKDVELCLEYSNGKPLSYFATYQELCTFLVEVLKWANKPSALLPELRNRKEFVVYANARGILIADDVAAYFCEEHNPMYNAERAAREGYYMFYRQGACPFDLLKYGMTNGILPDLQLPYPKGKELLHQNWDFIARYYLCEYYEGV